VPTLANASFVLIAFSEPWRAEQLEQLIGSLRPGLRVVQAHDGYAALAACKRELPRLLIVDGELDGLDGRALLRELRCRVPTQRLACILIALRGRPRTSSAGKDSAGREAVLYSKLYR